MRVIKTIVATLILIVSLVALYEICVEIYIGGYLSSYGTKLIIRTMSGAGGYMWGNIALIGTYLLGLLNIWNKEL